MFLQGSIFRTEDLLTIISTWNQLCGLPTLPRTGGVSGGKRTEDVCFTY